MSTFPDPLFGTHVLFTPRGSGVEYYLGHICGQGDYARWNASYDFPGEGMPVTGSPYQHFVQGSGVKQSLQIELCLPPSEIGDITGTLVNIGSTTRMLVETYEPASVMQALNGKLIRFKEQNETRVIASAPTQIGAEGDYTGTWLWYVEIDRAIDVFNGYEVRLDSYEYEYCTGWVLWWMNERMAPICENGWRGSVRIVKGLRNATDETLTNTTIEQTYTALLKQSAPKEPIIASAGLVYRLALAISDYEETDVSATEVSASDRTYTDGIVVTWEDVDYAARYQVYVTPSATAPAMVEQQTLTNGVYLNPDMATVHSAGGLLMEVAGADWAASGPEYLKALGIVDGPNESGYTYINDYLTPGNGLSAGAPAYPASDATIAAESHYWYWVRARVSKDGASDEWSDLSAAAHGVSKAI